MTAGGRYEELDSLRLPDGYIAGSVGAGDAFCSGVLYAAKNGKSLREGIELGTATAACSLGEADASSGVMTEAEVMAFYREILS